MLTDTRGDLFLRPGSITGADIILVPRRLSNPARRHAYEQVAPLFLGSEDARSILNATVVLLRPAGWQNALKRSPRVRNWTDVQKIVEHLFLQDYESVVILALNNERKLLAIHEAATGGLHGAAVDVRQALKVSMLTGASSVVIVHNHPSGDPTPSTQDQDLTENLLAAANALGIEVLDHIVVGYGGAVSSFRYLGISPQFSEEFSVDEAPIGADLMQSVRVSEQESQRLRRLWGGHGKLVVRTGLVPPPISGLPVVGNSSALKQLGYSLNLKEGELAVVSVDGHNKVRGVRTVNTENIVFTKELAREVLGFSMVCSASAQLFVLRVPIDYVNSLPLDVIDFTEKLRKVAEPIYSTLDFVLIDRGDRTISLHDLGLMR